MNSEENSNLKHEDKQNEMQKDSLIEKEKKEIEIQSTVNTADALTQAEVNSQKSEETETDNSAKVEDVSQSSVIEETVEKNQEINAEETVSKNDSCAQDNVIMPIENTEADSEQKDTVFVITDDSPSSHSKEVDDNNSEVEEKDYDSNSDDGFEIIKIQNDTQTESKDSKVKEKKSRKIDSVFDFVELFVFTLVAVLLLTTFVFKRSIVEGGSMDNTLHDGDQLIISDLFYTPKNGDIIVCEDYTTAIKKPIVKRVIAIEGQTVRIQKNGVYVDGVKLDEPYVYTDGIHYEYDVYPKYANLMNPTIDFVFNEYYELTVPKGEIFVMGDHRNKSTDSRDIGTVKVDSVLGKVVFRFAPFDKFGKVK